MTKNKLSGVKPDKEMMPDEITRKLITDDEEKSSIITKNYEKARYSDSEVSKEEYRIFRKSYNSVAINLRIKFIILWLTIYGI